MVLLLELRPHDGQWGEWFPRNEKWVYCNQSSFVSGFRLRMQSDQGFTYDDSALNSIELKCENGDGVQTG